MYRRRAPRRIYRPHKSLGVKSAADAGAALKNHTTATSRVCVSVGRFRIEGTNTRRRPRGRHFARLSLCNRRLCPYNSLYLICWKTAATTNRAGLLRAGLTFECARRSNRGKRVSSLCAALHKVTLIARLRTAGRPRRENKRNLLKTKASGQGC